MNNAVAHMASKTRIGRGLLVACITCTLITAPLSAPAQTPAPASATAGVPSESPWPLTLKAGTQTLTLYSPQLDRWDGFRLNGRMAVGVASADNPPKTHFGAVNVAATTLTDKSQRIVTIENATVTAADFPSATASEIQTWRAAIAADLTNKSRRIALDRLESQLAVSDAVAVTAKAPLRHDAPRVIFSPLPAMLIYVDGTPTYRAVAGTPYQRLINTRPLVLRDAQGSHFLKVFDGWMTATALDAQWSVLPQAPSALDAVFKQTMSQSLIDPLTGQTSENQPAPSLRTNAPRIYIATSPTELVVTDGAPNYMPIAGTSLLYLNNTTGNVLRDTTDNRLYVLAAGRWFRASQESGPWSYVASNALPPDFARIPDESPKENVKASVAGTTQAREAAIAASTPHTAAVTVAGTQMTAPQFDGTPDYRPIPGTDLRHAVNTPAAIIQVNPGSYYALQNGVWFTATNDKGPWSVALMVPAAIYTIPPGAPLYYATFVRIYGYGNGVVYEGYTPGYLGTYVDPVTGVVVYGTGYTYDPWIGTVWYGAPVTYGYGASMAYTPWTGWAIGFGFGWFLGAATVAMGWGWGPYPYWGPWAYPAWGAAWGVRGGAVAWGPGGWAGYTGNIYSQWGNRATVSRGAGGFDAWTGNAWATQVGKSYNSRTGIASAGQRGAVQNVYTGNFAAGGRGVATGPRGNVVVGGGGIAGNAFSGNAVAGGGGAVYNKNTGEWTTFGQKTGAAGTVGHVGDNVYAGHDGNVYRHNDSGGWEQRSGGSWQNVAGSSQGEATRRASGGLGATEGGGRSLEGERQARDLGSQRFENMRESSAGLSRSFGGHGGFRRR